MTTIMHRFETKASAAQLWRCLSDLTLVQSYNPTIAKATLTDKSKPGLGTLRVCDLKPMGKVTERVTVWEEGKALGLVIVESDWPITAMNWVTRIEPAPSGSVLTQRLDYSMKFGPFGALLNGFVMKRNITKNVGEALQGLIRMAETST